MVDGDGLAEVLDHIDEPDVDGGHVRWHSCGTRAGAPVRRSSSTVPCGRGYGRADAGVSRTRDSTRPGPRCVRDSHPLVSDRTTESARRSGRLAPPSGGPRHAAVRYRRIHRQNPDPPRPKGPDRRCPASPTTPCIDAMRDRPGARARARHRHPRHGQERRHRRLGAVAHHRADDAGLPAQGRDRAQRPTPPSARSARPASTSPGARWSAARSRARPSSSCRASRTSSPSRRARAASARARSASTWPSPWPRPAPSVGLLDADITGPEHPADARPRGPAQGQRQQQDHAARALRRQGHLDPVLRARGPADRLARAARRRRDPAVPARRGLGRARLPRHRPAAGHLRRPADARPGRADLRRRARHDAAGGRRSPTSARRSRCSSG